ncbi:MAG: type II toxin-antitoxin system VapC family toxin [Terriglobia bacterium]
MNGRFALDTNIVIALWEDELSLRRRFDEASATFVPSIVLGELYYGAVKSFRLEANLARVDEFAATNTVLSCDAGTAQHYGRIRADLSKKGRPIPDNDVWIAALAQQYGLTLVTRDEHFKAVGGLSVERW